MCPEWGLRLVLEAGVCVEAPLPPRPGLIPAPAAVALVLACVFTWSPLVLLIPPVSLLRTPAPRSGLTS